MPNTYNLPAGATLAPRTARSTLKFVVTAAQEIDVYGDLEGMDGLVDYLPLTGGTLSGDLGVPRINDFSGSRTFTLDGTSVVVETQMIVNGINGSLNGLTKPINYDYAANAQYVDEAIRSVLDGYQRFNYALGLEGSFSGPGTMSLEVYDVSATIMYLAKEDSAGKDMSALLAQMTVNDLITLVGNDRNNGYFICSVSGAIIDNVDHIEVPIAMHQTGSGAHNEGDSFIVNIKIAALSSSGDLMADGSVPMTGPLMGDASSNGLNLHSTDLDPYIVSVSTNGINFSKPGGGLLFQAFEGNIRIYPAIIDLSWGGGANIKGMFDPVDPQDAATKAYVDTGDGVLLAKIDTLETQLTKAMALITALQTKVDAL